MGHYQDIQPMRSFFNMYGKTFIKRSGRQRKLKRNETRGKKVKCFWHEWSIFCLQIFVKEMRPMYEKKVKSFKIVKKLFVSANFFYQKYDWFYKACFPKIFFAFKISPNKSAINYWQIKWQNYGLKKLREFETIPNWKIFN